MKFWEILVLKKLTEEEELFGENIGGRFRVIVGKSEGCGGF